MNEHKISLLTATLMNMNIMIGSGILIGPGFMAAVSGNASFLGWPLVALIFLPMVLCTAKLSRVFPGCGGFYAYTKEGINLTAGFFGGLIYVIGYTFAVAVEIMAFRQTLIANLGQHWFLTNAMLFNVTAMLVFIALNMISFKLFSQVMSSLTIAKILPLVILILLLPLIFNPNFTISNAEFAQLPGSLPFAIFGFFGFEYCCSLTHLIENSERNAPRAALFGFLATAALYMLFHFGVLQLMGPDQLAALGAPAFAQFLTLPVPFLKSFLIFLIPLASMLTIFAAGNGILNANLVMTQSMAQEKLFWKWPIIAKLNRFHRPWVAAMIQGVVVLTLITIMSNINLVANLCNLGIVTSYLLPFVSLFLIQRKRGLISSLPLTVLAIASTIGLSAYSWYKLGDTLSERMMNSVPLLIILAVGYVLFIMSDRYRTSSKPAQQSFSH